MGMNYDKINEWILAEDCPSLSYLGKCESVMAQGNGYLGLRAAMEERYVGETRNLLVNGTFNKFDAEEVTELPNAADVTAVELWIDGQRFHLAEGRMDEYRRELNIRTGELVRDVCWTAPNGKTVRFSFRRVVSLKRLHDIGFKVTVKTEREPIELRIRSGIDARVTNTGSQHFSEIEKRFYEKKYIQFVERTTQSDIDFVLNAVHRFEQNGNPVELETDVNIERRFIYADYSIALEAGETFTIEKLVNIHTTRDFDATNLALGKLQEKSLDDLKALEQMGYDALQKESARAWEEDVWERTPITIKGDKDSEFDLFALRYAQYEMRIFLPKHDNRMNIGAKGLSGEGYKGHCFWDTEIFLLPYYMFTDPQAARKLEEYRYLSLPGAHRKAQENGYQGAMFPWESAWLDDGETCPLYQGTDIVTGKPIKVWSGIIEQHISADVAFGVWQYGVITGDDDFMERYGYEIIMDTAIFWRSRLEQGDDGRYHINDVVGPDEYHEHVNDNAFTNYMASWNMGKAAEYCTQLQETKPELYARLDQKMNLKENCPKWKEGVEKLFCRSPQKREFFLWMTDL